jgi:hypothetical protein
MKRIAIGLMFLIILASSTCKKEEIHYDITVYNKSSSSIYMTWTDAYPDTLLRCPWGKEILPDEKYNISGGKYGWEDIFKSTQILQVFIVDADIAITEPCDTIRKYNWILKRYPLTYQDLQSINWTITYP